MLPPNLHNCQRSSAHGRCPGHRGPRSSMVSASSSFVPETPSSTPAKWPLVTETKAALERKRRDCSRHLPVGLLSPSWPLAPRVPLLSSARAEPGPGHSEGFVFVLSVSTQVGRNKTPIHVRDAPHLIPCAQPRGSPLAVPGVDGEPGSSALRGPEAAKRRGRGPSVCVPEKCPESSF